MATSPQPGRGPRAAAGVRPPVPPAKSAPGNSVPDSPQREDDGLSLQPLHSDEEQKAQVRRNRHRRMPDPVAGGKALDIGDTSKLLVYAGILVVATVLVTLWVIFKPEGKPAPSTPGPVASPDATKAPTPLAGAQKATAASPAPVDYTANPANKACYFAYGKFMSWAFAEAMEGTSEELTEKFKKDVSVKGVTDPDLVELCSQALEFFRIATPKPLRSAFGGQIRVDDSRGHGTDNATGAQQIKAINLNMRLLNRKALQRYGQPDLYQAPAGVAPMPHGMQMPNDPNSAPAFIPGVAGNTEPMPTPGDLSKSPANPELKVDPKNPNATRKPRVMEDE